MAIRVSDRIRELVARRGPELRQMTEAQVSPPRAPGKWSRKEILGHLVDSAANNHQRFVRAMNADELRFPAYVQVDWVKSQDYAGESWQLLVELWSALNLHLAHVIDRIPAARAATPIRLGDKEPVALEAVVADYLRHLEHHLEQLPA